VAEPTIHYKKKYPGNLAPYPTKSMQSYKRLKQFGIVDSKEVNLNLFYLQEGPQTKITEPVRKTADFILDGETTEQTIINIMSWEHINLKCSTEEKGKYEKRSRTAEEVILSKCATGCTDYTLVFATLARAKGIPATVTETISEKWVAEMVWNNKWDPIKKGHFFSEVFLEEDNMWVLVDPTANRLTGRTKEGYYLSGPDGKYKFMLFERGLDSWDYGIYTMKQSGEIVKKRYYVEPGDQP